MVVFQALTWEARDCEDEHHISIFGKTREGKSVCVTTKFEPYFFVKLPPGCANKGAVELLYLKLDSLRKDCMTGYNHKDLLTYSPI